MLAAAAVVVLLLACSPEGQRPAETPRHRGNTKYGVEVQTGPMDGILLKDYRPASSLVVTRTEIHKARFPAIDVHAHTSMNNIRTRGDVADWMRTMDEVGVERSVVFTGATGAEFDRQAELFLGFNRDRFQVYCALDTTGIDQPGYAASAVAELERCYRKGARGVGELSDKGWGLQGKTGLPRSERLHPDDSRLDAFWEKCAELRLPVNLHIADHPSCWQPLGPRQERTPDFQHFNMFGKDVPSFEELLAMRDRLLAKHPRTVFILCHFSNQGHDLAALGRVLDRYPNLYVDLSARDYEIGRQPRTALRFLEQYKSRVLFGTDMGRDKTMYQAWWRLLESADEFLPGRVWWPYYGLHVPPSILQQIYRGNALSILNWSPVL
jgi:uncharacterized protein